VSVCECVCVCVCVSGCVSVCVCLCVKNSFFNIDINEAFGQPLVSLEPYTNLFHFLKTNHKSQS
jgi:hypothetical protein